jgi:hypothetical protein
VGCAKPSGITPMTVCGIPLSDIVRPTTVGSVANDDRQSAWLITTTGAGDGPSSLAMKARPSVGCSRMVEKKLAVALVARSGLASPWVSQLACTCTNAAMSANDRWVLRSSS